MASVVFHWYKHKIQSILVYTATVGSCVQSSADILRPALNTTSLNYVHGSKFIVLGGDFAI